MSKIAMDTDCLKDGYEFQEYDTNGAPPPFIRAVPEVTLGSGHFGAIDLVREISGSKQLYARKSIKISNVKEDEKQKAIKEVKILIAARHGHVITLFDAYFYNSGKDNMDFVIIMDPAQKSLAHCLRDEKDEDRPNFPLWFGCLISVEDYIHLLGIRHRDIKPTNILIKDHDVLLADFGISRMGIGVTIPTTILALPRPSTPSNCAPEVAEGSTRGRSTDIFSLGTVFLEMLLAHSYRREYEKLEMIARSDSSDNAYAQNMDKVQRFMGEMNLQRVGWHEAVFSFCRRMLNTERGRRPSAEELHSDLSLRGPSELLQCRRCPKAVDETESYKLIKACKENDLKEVKQLLAGNSDPNTIGAIHQASTGGFTNIVKELRGKNANINLKDYGGQTALHCAAGSGKDEVVRLLLNWETKADVTVKDEEGRTALHCAAGNGSEKVVNLLLQNEGVLDVDEPDNCRQTALFYAARRGYEDVVQTLLNNGADVQKTDDGKRTALHLAAGFTSPEVVRILLKRIGGLKRIDCLDAKDMNGWTALHFAARKGHKEVVRELLKAGADVNADDHNERTPHRIAKQQGHDSVAQIISQSRGSIGRLVRSWHRRNE
jgi:ankyrin repeat protein